MLRLSPVILALIWGYATYRLSVWRTRRTLDAQSTELADPTLRALTGQMAQALDLPRIRVHIYEIAPVNGLAAEDGRIFITRGFFDRYRAGEVSAPELCSVIAHELGHVALGHSRRRMIDFAGQNAMRVGLTMVLSRLLPGIAPMVASGLLRLMSARLSREAEFEADAYATALLLKSGIGVAPQKTLFAKLARLTGQSGQGLAWLSSHPATEDRLRAIEANEARWR